MNDNRNGDGQSAGVLDALDAMKEALRHNEPDKCAACFDMLTSTLEEISWNPKDEDYYLREWSRVMLKRRTVNGCSNCHPPVRKDLF